MKWRNHYNWMMACMFVDNEDESRTVKVKYFRVVAPKDLSHESDEQRMYLEQLS